MITMTRLATKSALKKLRGRFAVHNFGLGLFSKICFYSGARRLHWYCGVGDACRVGRNYD